MKRSDVRRADFAMPLTDPSCPRGPYRFRDREYLIIACRTDPEALAVEEVGCFTEN